MESQRSGRIHPQTTIGGGFGHPLDSTWVAEPPLGAQGGGYDYPLVPKEVAMANPNLFSFFS